MTEEDESVCGCVRGAGDDDDEVEGRQEGGKGEDKNGEYEEKWRGVFCDEDNDCWTRRDCSRFHCCHPRLSRCRHPDLLSRVLDRPEGMRLRALLHLRYIACELAEEMAEVLRGGSKSSTRAS